MGHAKIIKAGKASSFTSFIPFRSLPVICQLLLMNPSLSVMDYNTEKKNPPPELLEMSCPRGLNTSLSQTSTITFPRTAHPVKGLHRNFVLISLLASGAQGPLGSWGCEPCLPGPQAVPWMWMHRMSGALLVQGPLPTCLDKETVGGFSLLLSAMSRRAPLYLFP